jgi:Asp-tRNA(Asn)/Glu-tRNA(Gln) amidotransferase B subunit/branched-subunit amino acid transport protein
MSLWLVMLAAGAVTFAIRFSFIGAAGRFDAPAWFVRALRFVPVAALSALVWPDLIFVNGTLSMTGPRLAAGLIAAPERLEEGLHRGLVEAARVRKPELPWEKRARFVSEFGVSDYDASVLANDLALASYFEIAARGAKKPKNVANWILNDLQSAISSASVGIAECPVAPHALDELVNLIDSGAINSKQGKEVFAEMFSTGKSAATIVEEKGLKQESDTGAIEVFVDQAIAANPGSVADFKAGKVSALNFLKGQVMKLSKGKANPALAGEILEKKLS